MLTKDHVIVLMFHHVHGSEVEYLHALNGVGIDDFESILLKVKEKYQVISSKDLLQGELEGDKPKAIITFDDGTIDNYYSAFPVLRKLGLPATFFLITKSISERWLAAVQIRHLLRNAMTDEEFSDEFIKLAPLDVKAELQKLDPVVFKAAYRWDNNEVARFKYYVNFAMPFEAREEILSTIFRNHIGDLDEWGDKVYLNWSQVHEMREQGMYFGGHSHHHEALAMLPRDQMKSDLQTCAQILSENLGLKELPFSYPFGKNEHFNDDTEAVLAANRFHSSYLNVQGINEIGLANWPYKILRFDPKDVIRQALI